MPKGILFICGSLEPGQDGVGDYTRRLAAELQAMSCDIFIVATHDKKVETVTSVRQAEGGREIETQRIPYGASSAQRLTTLQRTIDAFRPGWISLQYVPHAFNRKGIPADLLFVLARLNTLAARHIMFHELWITPESPTNLKDQLLTGLERMAVSLLLGRLFRPAVVHTHLPAYRNRLLKKGASVCPLPLFANIGNTAEDRKERQPQTAPFRVVFFSQLSTPPAVIEFLGSLQAYLHGEKRSLEILLLGGGPKKVETAAGTIARALPDARIVPVGFRAAHEISSYLVTADLGLTPVLRHEIGKSGTVAAFLTHRLPVAAPCFTDTTESFFLAELNRAVLSTFSPTSFRQAYQSARDLDVNLISVHRIAHTMVADLEEAAGGPTAAPRQLTDATLSK